jgi:lipid A 3-O-deacylase
MNIIYRIKKLFKRIYRFLILFLFVLPVNEPFAQTSDMVSVSLSYFNVLRKSKNAIESRFEYRSAIKLWELKPFVGIMATSDKAFYALAGFYYDIRLSDKIILTPSFAPGYFSKGNGMDLAYELEFRSQLEVSYIFENRSRLGFSFSHMSNANFGESNPGVESIAIIYSIPLSLK